MQLQPFVEALEREVTEAASFGDEAAARAAARIVQVLAAPARLQMLQLAGEAALEVTSQLPSGHVEVRLVGNDPALLYVAHDIETAAPVAGDDAAARITLRLPEGLKGSVEEAAARDSVSVNAWLVRAVSRQLANPDQRGRQVGNRLTGFARS